MGTLLTQPLVASQARRDFATSDPRRVDTPGGGSMSPSADQSRKAAAATDSRRLDLAKTSASNAKTQAAASAAAANKPPESGDKTATSVYQYPADNAEYMTILKFGPYSRSVALENKLVDHNLFICLPLPNNLSEAFGASYNNVQMGLLKPAFGVLNGVVSDVQGGSDVRKAVTDRIAGGINALADDKNYTWALAAAASTIQALGGDALSAGVNMTAGMIPNPNLAVNFNGVPLRSYSFSWRCAPRSPEESQSLIDIIFSIKQRMHPTKDNFALRYPDYCEVELSGGPLKQLLLFKTSVVSDMRVNYAPSGIPSFFAGTQLPTEMDIAMTFNEIEIFTRKDFENKPSVKGSPDKPSILDSYY